MRFRRWRLVVTVLLLVLIGTAGWLGWQGWHALRDLKAAEASAEDLRASFTNDDPTVRDRAIDELQEAASSARGRTDGPLWGALTRLPGVGDDVRGVRAISSSLDTLATDAVPPLVTTVDGLDGITTKGRIDLDAVRRLETPVHEANAALAVADADVSHLDSSGYVGPLKSRFDTYVDLVGDAARGLAAGDKAVSVLPTMAGADGPRNYLMIFQNNAEIRATGGMPGSWALVHADDGQVNMVRQGTPGDFGGELTSPVLPLSPGEVAVYDEQLGTYFQDANFTPDFPRAAELWAARWKDRFPESRLDGVISLDPVAMSYMLRGTGNIEIEDLTLTPDNFVDQLLNQTYIDLGPTQQDALFAEVARELFDAVTGGLSSPVSFVSGLDQAASEGRFLVASFDDDVERELSGTRVTGELASDDDETPHVDIGLNDLTGAKMSYYLRYTADVSTIGCRDGMQDLSGSLTLNQVITPNDAVQLPPSVTGDGSFGTEPGSQFIMVRVYGPYGGSIDTIHIDGRTVSDLPVHRLDGRPVVSIAVLLSSRKDVLLTWQMGTAKGQTGDGVLSTTPSVVSRPDQSTFQSAC